jgi:hypothetical protein
VSDQPAVRDGDPVTADRVRAALTGGEFVYDDGAIQTFEADGTTTYIDGGRPTRGEWSVDDGGRFCSFWPPTYRACYDLSWAVEAGRVVGLTFRGVEDRSTFVGRYRDPPA